MNEMVLAIGCMIVVFGLIVYFLTYHRRKGSGVLDRVAASLGFRKSPSGESIHPDTRRGMAHALFSSELIQGERDGIPIEVSVDPSRALGDPGGYPTTTALFVWPRPVAPPGTYPGLSRMAGESEPKSVFSGALQRGYGADPTFGWSELYGTEAERSMVLTTTVRAKLKALPRPLAEVRFYPDALKIIWKGIDESPATFEESFKIGIACLESLAPRSR